MPSPGRGLSSSSGPADVSSYGGEISLGHTRGLHGLSLPPHLAHHRPRLGRHSSCSGAPRPWGGSMPSSVPKPEHQEIPRSAVPSRRCRTPAASVEARIPELCTYPGSTEDPVPPGHQLHHPSGREGCSRRAGRAPASPPSCTSCPASGVSPADPSSSTATDVNRIRLRRTQRNRISVSCRRRPSSSPSPCKRTSPSMPAPDGRAPS